MNSKKVSQGHFGTVVILFLVLSSLSYSSDAQMVSSWLSKPGVIVQPQGEKLFSDSQGDGWMTIDIDHKGGRNRFQTIDGFGAAVTGSSAYLIRKMSSEKRKTLLQRLFGSRETDLKLRMIRHTIGSSDFNKVNNPNYPYNEWFSYSDLPKSTSCTSENEDVQVVLSEYDEKYLIPTLKEIVAISGDIKILGSAWSAPRWMKTSKKLGGGRLDPACYQHYSNYLRNYIKAYKQSGITVWGITTQNEPQHSTFKMPSMLLSSQEQIDFIHKLGPTIRNDDDTKDTKIIIYDHNWSVKNYPDAEYPIKVLDNSIAKSYVDGTGFHGYGGNVRSQSTLHKKHSDKGIWFTEQTGTAKYPDFDGNMRWYMENLFIGGVRHHAKSVLFWNIALDSNHGPRSGGFCTDCRGVVTIDGDNVEENEEFFSLEHVSRFVQQGATRIYTNLPQWHINAVAFENPDGSIVLLARNRVTWSKSETINFRHCGKTFTYKFDKYAIVTFKWTKAC